MLGSDGALWFTESRGNAIGRITTSGAITEYALPAAESMPGPSIDLRWDPPLVATGTTFAMHRSVSAERTVATFTDGDPDTRPSDSVTIKWGDGSRPPGESTAVVSP